MGQAKVCLLPEQTEASYHCNDDVGDVDDDDDDDIDDLQCDDKVD